MFAHGCTCATANIYLLLSRYKNLISWVSKLRNDRKECPPSNWDHPLALFEAFKNACPQLWSKQILVPSNYTGKVGVHGVLDEFILCKRSLSCGCTHLHTGCTSYLRSTRQATAEEVRGQACGSVKEIWRSARLLCTLVLVGRAAWRLPTRRLVAEANLKKVA